MRDPDLTRRLLEAGALLAGDLPGTDDPDRPVDRVSVRGYRHPALGDRVVRRLSADALASGEDLEMEFLGFGAPEIREGVGVQRRRALGFPGWALIHDPARAGYALEVVKSFERQARMARTKPGAAKEGFDAIAEQLARSVPHFLPSFHEEVGRTFLAHGNAAYAAQAFNRAREAERVHALDVDEELRKQSFLEFALAGAVSTKAMSEYARELGRAGAPAEAWAHFRDLVIQRTLGGLAPWAGMARELRSLAKAAGLSRSDADREVLAAIGEAPSLPRAAADFWKAYRAAFVARCAEAPATRAVLLDLHPELPVEAWLAFLDACGVLDALAAGEVRPRAGLAAWFDRTYRDLSRGWRGAEPVPDRYFTLLEACAPALRAEGGPLTLPGRFWSSSLDLDLCEHALALGLEVAPAQGRLDLVQWAQAEPGRHRLRDPVRVAAHPVLGGVLARALDEAMGSAPFEAASRDLEGFRELRGRWLEGVLRGLHGGLYDAEQALETLEQQTDPATFLPYPELYAHVRQLDLADPLARTLRGGIPDELGWPALDAVVEELDPDGSGQLTWFGTFPYAIVSDGLQAVVVGPAGRELTHTLRLPKGGELRLLQYVGDELLVVYRAGPREGASFYYSGSPGASRPIEGAYYGIFGDSGWVARLPDGSVTFGSPATRPGGDGPVPSGFMLCDGETYWTLDWRDGQRALVEVEPTTWTTGRRSLPRFLEDFVADDRPLDLDGCRLMPVPEAVAEGSPLGTAGGLAGFRRRGPAPVEAEGIDGRRYEGPLPPGTGVEALVSFPGHDVPRLLLCHHLQGRTPAPSLVLADPEGPWQLAHLGPEPAGYVAGASLPLPVRFWHYLRPRDEAASRALRQRTADDVVGWLAADAEIDLPVAAPRLRRGLHGIVGHARGLAARLQRLVADRHPSAAEAAPRVHIPVDVMQAAVGELLPTRWGHGDDACLPLRRARRFFEGGEPEAIPESAIGWPALLGRERAVAYRAVAAGTPPEHREALRELLWAWLPFCAWRGRLRVLTRPVVEGAWPFTGRSYLDGPVALIYREHRYVAQLSGAYWGAGEVMLLELAPEGASFEDGPPPAEGEVRSVHDPSGPREGALERFLRAAEERGPPPFDPGFVAHVHAETGMTVAEASLLWAGLPGLHDWAHNFLDKELRTTLGLKVAEAAAARDALKALSEEDRRALLAAMVPDDPALLWAPFEGQPDHPAARVAEAYRARVGARVAVPAELITECERALKGLGDPTRWLTAIADPASAAVLQRDATWRLVYDWPLLQGDDDTAFDPKQVGAALAYVAYLYEQRPLGDPFRAALPRVVELLRARAASPDLLVPLDQHYLEEEEAEQRLAAFEGSPVDAPDGLQAREDRGLVAVRAGYRLGFFARPSAIEADDPRVAAVGDFEGALTAIGLLRSPTVDDLIAHIARHATPEGAFEANPAISVPALVAEVAEVCGVGDDAAVLYLQTLALPHPSTKAVRRLNGWTAKRYTAAAQELVEAGRLLAAKRARAGRGHFLPGGWEAYAAPNPPMESWKVPLYGGAPFPLGRALVLEPLPALFARAWARVQQGDPPRYEDVDG